MVINYQKYPLLRYFENGFRIIDSNGFKTFNVDYTSQKELCNFHLGQLYKHWDYIKIKCCGIIQIFSENFRKAVFGSARAFNKINKDIHDILKMNQESGVFVYNSNGCYMVYVHYSNDIIQIWFYEKECLTSVLVWDLNTDRVNCEFASKNLKDTTSDEYINYVWHLFVLPMLFKKYAKIKIEYGKCGKTIRSRILNDKVRNKISINVKIMDSTWFTTICRNEGFKVRGHFRLQPKKVNGEWIKELIYINEFEKHGYHRIAKIEKYGADN